MNANNLTHTIIEDLDGESQCTIFSRANKKNPTSSVSRISIGPRALNGYRSNLALADL